MARKSTKTAVAAAAVASTATRASTSKSSRTTSATASTTSATTSTRGSTSRGRGAAAKATTTTRNSRKRRSLTPPPPPIDFPPSPEVELGEESQIEIIEVIQPKPPKAVRKATTSTAAEVLHPKIPDFLNKNNALNVQKETTRKAAPVMSKSRTKSIQSNVVVTKLPSPQYSEESEDSVEALPPVPFDLKGSSSGPNSVTSTKSTLPLASNPKYSPVKSEVPELIQPQANLKAPKKDDLFRTPAASTSAKATTTRRILKPEPISPQDSNARMDTIPSTSSENPEKPNQPPIPQISRNLFSFIEEEKFSPIRHLRMNYRTTKKNYSYYSDEEEEEDDDTQNSVVGSGEEGVKQENEDSLDPGQRRVDFLRPTSEPPISLFTSGNSSGVGLPNGSLESAANTKPNFRMMMDMFDMEIGKCNTTLDSSMSTQEPMNDEVNQFEVPTSTQPEEPIPSNLPVAEAVAASVPSSQVELWDDEMMDSFLDDFEISRDLEPRVQTVPVVVPQTHIPPPSVPITVPPSVKVTPPVPITRKPSFSAQNKRPAPAQSTPVVTRVQSKFPQQPITRTPQQLKTTPPLGRQQSNVFNSLKQQANRQSTPLTSRSQSKFPPGPQQQTKVTPPSHPGNLQNVFAAQLAKRSGQFQQSTPLPNRAQSKLANPPLKPITTGRITPTTSAKTTANSASTMDYLMDDDSDLEDIFIDDIISKNAPQKNAKEEEEIFPDDDLDLDQYISVIKPEDNFKKDPSVSASISIGDAQPRPSTSSNTVTMKLKKPKVPIPTKRGLLTMEDIQLMLETGGGLH